MKKLMLIPALLAAAPLSAHAARAAGDHSGLYTGPTVQLRGGGGGDELVAVTYTNGDTDKIRAGDGGELAVGWHLQSYRNAPFDLRAQVGYRYMATRNSSNANFHLDRVTWELIPSAQLGAGFWSVPVCCCIPTSRSAATRRCPTTNSAMPWAATFSSAGAGSR